MGSVPTKEADALISWVSLWILALFALPALSKPSTGARFKKSANAIARKEARGRGVCRKACNMTQ